MKRLTLAALLIVLAFAFNNSLALPTTLDNVVEVSKNPEKEKVTTKLDLESDETLTLGPDDPSGSKVKAGITMEDVKEIGKKFCQLYRFIHEKGAGPKEIKTFIQENFPKKWHEPLIGRLILRGLLALVDTAAELCGIKEKDATKVLQKALAYAPKYHHIINFVDDL